MITFPATYGHITKQVKITRPLGAGEVYYIFIDDFYQGVLSKSEGVWIGHLNGNSHLTSEDILILRDMILPVPKSVPL